MSLLERIFGHRANNPVSDPVPRMGKERHEEEVDRFLFATDTLLRHIDVYNRLALIGEDEYSFFRDHFAAYLLNAISPIYQKAEAWPYFSEEYNFNYTVHNFVSSIFKIEHTMDNDPWERRVFKRALNDAARQLLFQVVWEIEEQRQTTPFLDTFVAHSLCLSRTDFPPFPEISPERQRYMDRIYERCAKDIGRYRVLL